MTRGRLLRGPVRGLDRDEDVPLSSTGMNDLGRSTIIQAVSASSAERRHDDGPPVMGGELQERVIRVLEPLHAPVEPAEEEELRFAVIRLGLQEQAGPSRG